MPSSSENITQLLSLAAGGDDGASARLLPLIYKDLRRLAGGMMSKLPPGQTLQPTALVHEAFLRLSGRDDLPVESRKQYFLYAARAMRDILVEQARRKSRVKRGGDLQKVELKEIDLVVETPVEDVLALNEALERIKREDPDGHQIIMLRYFVGFSVPEIAEVSGVSVSTIERRWRYLRAWLAQELEGPAL